MQNCKIENNLIFLTTHYFKCNAISKDKIINTNTIFTTSELYISNWNNETEFRIICYLLWTIVARTLFEDTQKVILKKYEFEFWKKNKTISTFCHP